MSAATITVSEVEELVEAGTLDPESNSYSWIFVQRIFKVQNTKKNWAAQKELDNEKNELLDNAKPPSNW
jgi:hypothetical protein